MDPGGSQSCVQITRLRFAGPGHQQGRVMGSGVVGGTGSGMGCRGQRPDRVNDCRRVKKPAKGHRGGLSSKDKAGRPVAWREGGSAVTSLWVSSGQKAAGVPLSTTVRAV